MPANPQNENSSSAESTAHTSHLRVTGEDAGERLDRYLVAQMPELSRTRIQQLISEERVLVAGHPARASHRVAEGESVQIEVLSRPPLAAEAEDIPIELLYEDEDIVVVNKPAGMIVHSGAGQSRGTLVNALLHRRELFYDCRMSGNCASIHVKIFGMLVVARNDAAHQALSEQFGAREVEKVYATLVHGQMEEASGSITLPVARDLLRRTRMTTKRREGREARTDWRVIARIGPFSLLEIQLHTGRTHQIRVHLSAVGHPVVGDAVYGAPREPIVQGKKLSKLGRPFLHAARLGFSHPKSGKRVTFRAPIDPALRTYLSEIAEAAGASQASIDAALKAYL